MESLPSAVQNINDLLHFKSNVRFLIDSSQEYVNNRT